MDLYSSTSSSTLPWLIQSSANGSSSMTIPTSNGIHGDTTSTGITSGSFMNMTKSPAVSSYKPLSSSHKRDASSILVQAGGAASSSHMDDMDNDDNRPKKPRMALSCSECKRRKIKCDRNVPCTACIKRGTKESCNWEEARIDPTPQPFAMREDLAELSDQVQILQARVDQMHAERQLMPTYISNLINGSANQTEAAGDLADISNTAGRPRTASSVMRPSVNHRASTLTPTTRAVALQMPISSTKQEDDLHDLAEDAAVALESVAFHPPSLFDSDGSRVVTSHEFWIESNHGKKRNNINKNDDDNAPAEIRASDPDLTSALTSITAPKWDPWQEQFSALLISKDLSLTNSLEITAIRMESLNVIYRNLPSEVQSWWLLHKFKERVHWRIHVLHMPCFEAEMAKFWEMTARGRFADVDPLWLSLFLMVMAITHDTRPADIVSDDDPFKRYSATELDSFTNKWHVGSLRALFLGDFMGTPRFRTVQTIVLFSQYFQQSRDTNKGRRWMYWLSIGVRTAHLLGLNSLGSDPEIMPPDDPAWPPGKNSIKRNQALRVWMALQWADWKCASANFQSYIINPAQTTTQLVDNVNDSDLSATDWRISIKPAGVATSTTFERYKWGVANMLRITYDKLATEGAEFSYVTVLELDRLWKKMLDEMPELFQPPDTPPEGQDQKFWLQQNVALAGVMARVVRLHRPFLSRGYAKDSKFAYSKQQCLLAARTVIECHQRIRHVIASGIFWFIYSQTLAAAIVLYMDLFWCIDNHEPTTTVQEKRQLTAKIENVFALHSRISNRSLQAIVRSAHSVVKGLSMEAEARQSSANARRFNPDVEALLPKLETFADVMKRISSTLHSPSPAVVPTQLSKSAASSAMPAMQLQEPSQFDWSQLGGFTNGDMTASAWGGSNNGNIDFSGDIWSALGLTDHMMQGTDTSFTTFNLSPASQHVATDGQPDLSFLAGTDEGQHVTAATNYLLHQTGGIGDTF